MNDLTPEQKIKRLQEMVQIDEENMTVIKPLLMNCSQWEHDEHMHRYNKLASRIGKNNAEIHAIEAQMIKKQEDEKL